MNGEIKNINDWEILTPSGWSNFSGIKKTIVQEYYKIIIDSEIVVKCSTTHRFKTITGDFVRANKCIKNTILFNNRIITDIQLIKNELDVYDILNVERENEYIANELVHHNCHFIAKFEEKWASLQQTLATGGDCIVLSTPNGAAGWFFKVWSDSENNIESLDGSDKYAFNPIKLPWQVHPERDQKWRDAQDKKLGKRLAAQECDASFLTSGNTVVDPETLQIIKRSIKDPILKEKDFWIWELPKEGEQYIISADVARGDGTDYSAFHVLKQSTLEQVAEFKGKIGTKEYGIMLCEKGKQYNNALLIVENLSVGWNTIQTILDQQYINFYYSIRGNNTSMYLDENIFQTKGYNTLQNEDKVPGFVTSTKTRPQMVDKLESMIGKDVLLHSQRTYDELLVFVWLNGKAQAQSGYNDDLIMSLSIGLYVYDTAIKMNRKSQEYTAAALTGYGSSLTNQDVNGVYSSNPNVQDPMHLKTQVNGGEVIDWSFLQYSKRR